MNRRSISLTALAGAVAVFAAATIAEAISIDMVTVGNPGNAPDTRYGTPGYGAVGYTYQIGKFEITAGQYTAFLNAVAARDPYGLYNSNMDSFSSGCQITRHGVSGTYVYDFSGRPSGNESDWANRPVNYVSWGDAARFVNWISHGQPRGMLTGIPAQDGWLTEDGSYDLKGATSSSALMAITRKSNATWVIPREDEWYKAAYYDPNKGGPGVPGYGDYPTKSDAPPINTLLSPDTGNHANFYDSYDTGNGTYTIGPPYWRTPVGAFANSASAYGTFDQGGNVWERNETVVLGGRGLRGGSFRDSSDRLARSYRNYAYPSTESDSIGFRVAGIPEPGSFTLLLAGVAAVVFCRLRRRWSKG